jgi:hypothetical protein
MFICLAWTLEVFFYLYLRPKDNPTRYPKKHPFVEFIFIYEDELTRSPDSGSGVSGLPWAT